jgi:hypothetical protein
MSGCRRSTLSLTCRIRLAANDRRADNPAQWRGQNLLGKILTRLRDELLAV